MILTVFHFTSVWFSVLYSTCETCVSFCEMLPQCCRWNNVTVWLTIAISCPKNNNNNTNDVGLVSTFRRPLSSQGVRCATNPSFLQADLFLGCTHCLITSVKSFPTHEQSFSVHPHWLTAKTTVTVPRLQSEFRLHGIQQSLTMQTKERTKERERGEREREGGRERGGR